MSPSQPGLAGHGVRGVSRLGLGTTLVTLCLLTLGTAHALPRMSLTAGSPCVTCHTNPVGGAGRNALGFESMNDVGIATFGDVGLGALDVQHNTLGDRVSLGYDFRVLWARLGQPTVGTGGAVEVPDYVAIPMQFQTALSVQLTETLSVYGTYSAGAETMSDGVICDPHFPGQECFDVAVQFESPGLPMVRVGMIQPSVGIRLDDHTTYIRGDAADRGRPIIAPNYADWGAEAMYHPVSWFRVEAGAVVPDNLDAALNGLVQTADLGPAAYSARISYLPQLIFGGPPAADAGGDDDFDDDFDDDAPPPPKPTVLNTWLGASIFACGDFSLVNGFLGVGSHAGWEVRAEVSRSTRTTDYETLNAMVAASYTPVDWLSFGLRAERARTQTDDGERKADQYVAGLEFFVLPGVELRPEYRLVETEAFRFGHAVIQLHTFF